MSRASWYRIRRSHGARRRCVLRSSRHRGRDRRARPRWRRVVAEVHEAAFPDVEHAALVGDQLERCDRRDELHSIADAKRAAGDHGRAAVQSDTSADVGAPQVPASAEESQRRLEMAGGPTRGRERSHELLQLRSGMHRHGTGRDASGTGRLAARAAWCRIRRSPAGHRRCVLRWSRHRDRARRARSRCWRVAAADRRR